MQEQGKAQHPVTSECRQVTVTAAGTTRHAISKHFITTNKQKESASICIYSGAYTTAANAAKLPTKTNLGTRSWASLPPRVSRTVSQGHTVHREHA
jgi:hypothetical protein